MSDEIVLVSGVRTPIGRMGGRWAEVPAADLGAAAVRGALAAAPGLTVDYVAMANVVQAGNGQNPARVAATRGGVPRTVPGITLNDVCPGSMSAVALAAMMIRGGEASAVLVGGFESMTRAPRQPVDLLVNDGLHCALGDVAMGPLSDRENARLGISRADQDAFAHASHMRAAQATSAGRLSEEIVVDGLVVPGGLALDQVWADEGIRPGTTLERLGELRPAFARDGTITAGNASQMSDAGAAGVITTRDRAAALGLTPLAAVVGRAVIAGEDSSLHLRPAQAANLLLERHGMTAADVDLWEINEAFAGVVLASMAELGIDHDEVNVNGGAVALGHPLGASGFRLVLTLAHEMRRRGAETGVAAICGGGGQGQAILLRSIP
ncbi:acetyl-CoA C-acyltransferase [Micromonospora sp. NPDC007271]|uniref:thiolase family protein n=1 Tax=Micromonospora sp. NPDC007271 TaxID=3154587 RepID=UPI003411C282